MDLKKKSICDCEEEGIKCVCISLYDMQCLFWDMNMDPFSEDCGSVYVFGEG